MSLKLARWHLQRAATLQGQSPTYLYTLAQAEFLAGAYEAAEAACEQSLRADLSNFDALLLLAEIQLRLKKPTEAFKAARQAIKLYKHREEGWLLAARAAAEAGQPDKAIEFLELYLKQNQQNQLVGPLAYILLSRVYLDTGRAEQALDQLEQAQARLRALFIGPGPAFIALRARILRDLERAEEALEYYQQAIELEPQNSTLHNELGETLLDTAKYEDALKTFRQALHLEPENALYHCQAGVAALKSAGQPGQFSKRAEAYQQQAIELLTKATQLDETKGEYWYELALAYQSSRNYTQVKNALTQALAHSSVLKDAGAGSPRPDSPRPDSPRSSSWQPASARTYLRLYSLACLKLGQYDEARKALQEILEALPDDHETMNELGQLCYRMGQYGEAFNYFRKAETITNDHPRYLANMSRVLLRLERLDEARELVEEAAELDAGDHFVHHQLGAVLLETGKPADALEHLREAAGQEPDNPEFRYYLGRAYLQLGQVSEAIQEYQEAVAHAPMQHQWHAELGEIYLKEHSYLPALESLRLAAQLEPSEPHYRYNLAIALAANGDIWGAIHNLREVISVMGDEVGAEWHYLLGRMLVELGRHDEALESFARANKLEPDNPDYKIDLARSLRLKGEPIDQVKNLLEEAIADNPQELRSFEELAYVYEASDDPEAALRTLESRLSEVLNTVRTSDLVAQP
jgi:tetratricopeptide (TPR) repeat protein